MRLKQQVAPSDTVEGDHKSCFRVEHRMGLCGYVQGHAFSKNHRSIPRGLGRGQTSVGNS